MDAINDLKDDEFIPFLHKLGVETYNKSFEWMLNDPDCSGVLRWMYRNLDHNNALDSREEYRYKEIEKSGKLLLEEDLESTVKEIQSEYNGICLPGDHDSFKDMQLDIQMQNERLKMLENHSLAIKKLNRKNDQIKEQLTIEVTKLQAAQQQCVEDEQSAAKQCLTLAEEVVALTDDVVDITADTLGLYAACNTDKEIAKQFIAFESFESYKQSQALFRSHFDLYTAKKFNKVQDAAAEREMRGALAEAKTLEDRLYDSIIAYIESQAELAGEQAKLSFINNYTDIHPSEIPSILAETRSALELLEQEEQTLEQQIEGASRHLAESRTKLAVDTTLHHALAVRERVCSELRRLAGACSAAAALDGAGAAAARAAIERLRDVLHFADAFATDAQEDARATAARIESMHEICEQQELCEMRNREGDVLVASLREVLGAEDDCDRLMLMKLYAELQNGITELADNVEEACQKKQQVLEDLESSRQPLRDAVLGAGTEGATGAGGGDAEADAASTEQRVADAGVHFTSVKNGDEQCVRKVWQWFLTDPSKLLRAIRPHTDIHSTDSPTTIL